MQIERDSGAAIFVIPTHLVLMPRINPLKLGWIKSIVVKKKIGVEIFTSKPIENYRRYI